MMEWLSEVLAISGRWNTKVIRQPILIFFSLVQPLVWFLLFTQAFSAIGGIPNFQQLTGTSSYITFFTAAVIIQTITSQALQTGIGLVRDIDSGFLDKMRVAPIRKSSILFGKLFSDAITIVVQVLIILVIGYLAGVRVASGMLGVVVILFISAAFGIAWSGISLFVALTTRNQQSTLSIGLLTTFPLLFLSAAVMPLGLLPSWVQQVAKINPFTYVARAFQSLIVQGFIWDTLIYAFLAIIIIGVISLGASVALFRKKVN
jgi:ABC-2 type transport system permease protein